MKRKKARVSSLNAGDCSNRAKSFCQIIFLLLYRTMNILRKLGTVVCFFAFMPTTPKCVMELTRKASDLEKLVTSLHLTCVAMEHDSLRNCTGTKYCFLLTQFLPLSLSTCA